MKHAKTSSAESRSGSLKWFLFALLGVSIAFLLMAVTALVAFYVQLDRSLPSTKSLKEYNPPIVSTMYDANGSLIGEFYTERRYVVSLADMPDRLKNAFLAAEDARFYEHRGVDPVSIFRALFKNVQAGEIVQGGSTITQQVVKSLLLTPERTWIRKLKEAILAYRIDRSLTKDEILSLYLNQAYLGAGAYGVEGAAQTYFGKHVGELTLAESALLAGLPKAPTRFSPFQNFQAARERQKYVLDRMVEVGFITAEDAAEAYAEEVRLAKSRYENIKELNSFTEEVRRQVEARYGRGGLYKDGLQVYTTLDPGAQKMAENALSRGLREIDRRHSGYRGPHRNVPRDNWPAFVKELEERNREAEKGQLVEALVLNYDAKARAYELDLGVARGQLAMADAKWAQAYLQKSKGFRPGDAIWVDLVKLDGNRWSTRINQQPEVQGAIMSIAPDTGRVICMVGGRDFESSQFNRATQAIRQPGSSFKPIIYAAALDKGYTPASILIDSPFTLDDGTVDEPWTPSNYDHEYWGPIQFRTALINSRNVVTVKLLQDIGVNYAISYARRLGVQSALARNLTLALGSSGITLNELMTAYSVFANRGERSKPYLIEKVLDRRGNLLEQHYEQHESVISPQTAYIMTNILQGVVEEGTGRLARKLGRPAAGKTGTTNELKDAWFMGYTPSHLTGVWVGYDDNRKSLGPGETGGHAACPIWLYFMEDLLKDEPVDTFPIPPGIVFMKMNASSRSGASRVVYTAFAEDNMPRDRIVRQDKPADTENPSDPSAPASSSGSSSSFIKSDLF